MAVEATFGMRVGNAGQWLKASPSRRLSERLFCILFWPLRKGCRRRHGWVGNLGQMPWGGVSGDDLVCLCLGGYRAKPAQGSLTDDFALKRFLSLSLPLSPSACPIAQKTVWRLTVGLCEPADVFPAGCGMLGRELSAELVLCCRAAQGW